MATTQYIGARYVPVFYADPDTGSNNWRAGIAYDPLTIVTDLNQSYTSRIPVPDNIGRPSENPTYWVMTGGYNAQINQLQMDVDAMTETVDDHTEAITDIESALDANDITATGYAVWIGDSFVQASSLGADADKRFSTVVSNRLNLIEKNYAAGGCGYITGDTTYPLQVTNAITDFTSNNIDPELVKYVFFVNSLNDNDLTGANITAFLSAATSCINAAVNYFTKATIVIIPILTSADDLLINFMENLYQLCVNVPMSVDSKITIMGDSYKWLNGMWDMIMYQNGAMIHPNISGHKQIATHILSVLAGSDYWTPTHYVGTPGSALTGINNVKFEIVRNSDFSKLRIQFETGATVHQSTGMIFDYNYPAINTEKLWFGWNHILYGELTSNNGADSSPHKVNCPIRFTRSGDNAGNYRIACYMYTGGLQPNTKYQVEFSKPTGLHYPDAYFEIG